MIIDAFKRNKRRTGVYSGRGWVPARTADFSYRSPIFVDGITSTNGIPASIKGRSEIGGEFVSGHYHNQAAEKGSGQSRRTAYSGNIMKMVKTYPLCASWLVFMLTIGAILQWVIK